MTKKELNKINQLFLLDFDKLVDRYEKKYKTKIKYNLNIEK